LGPNRSRKPRRRGFQHLGQHRGVQRGAGLVQQQHLRLPDERAVDRDALALALGRWIVLPLVTMLLFVNRGLGAISRVAAQINIFAIGFSSDAGRSRSANSVRLMNTPSLRRAMYSECAQALI